MKKIRVGSRESKLAVAQAELIIDLIKKYNKDIEAELITMKTTGDKILDKTLDKIGGKGLFVKELDKALLNKEIDIAVHSLKDMPMETDTKLPIIAYSKREDPIDVLILKKGAEFKEWQEKAKETAETAGTIGSTGITGSIKPIGSSSLRRIYQLNRLYPGVEVKPIRGNILTRLEKLDNGEYSALILAKAGIKRLGLEERISKQFSIKEILPAAGQGILAVQGRAGEDYSYLDKINDFEAQTCALCERAFVRELNGGCTSKIAAFASVENDTLTVECMYDSGEKASYKGDIDKPEQLGIMAARKEAEKYEKRGKVWLVGAGPSDPELLTIKAKKVLEAAEVVVYDRLIGDGILSLMPDEGEKIYVGKEAGYHAVTQDKINEILLKKALEGKRVVRLKGGDPFVFGRGGEELELLCDNNVPFEIVPGITSAVSVAAYNGIPVTYRDYCSSLHIITGHKKKDEPLDIDFEALVRLKGTLVFLMGVSSIENICSGLLNAGMSADMPAAVLENGTKATQRKIVSNISNLYNDAKTAKIKSPAIILVGEVCRLSDRFEWYSKRELAGLRAIVTRPKSLNSRLTNMLRDKGAEVIELPSIKTKYIENNAKLRECIEHINKYSYIALTSPTGAEIFLDELIKCGKDIRTLNNIKFAVIGSATGEVLKKRGIIPSVMPSDYNGRELGRAIIKDINDGNGEWLLLPRAKEGALEITEELSKADINIDDVPTYETIYESPCFEADDKFINSNTFVVFTSASTVKGFVNSTKLNSYSEVTAVCIGEKTLKAANQYNMQTFVSDEASVESLVQCVCKVYREIKSESSKTTY